MSGSPSAPGTGPGAGPAAGEASRPVVDFDHHRPDFDPKRAYGELRRDCPVAWSEHYGGFWILSRYEDIANAARADATFSSARDAGGRGGIVIPQWTDQTSIPIELDPPEQMVYRRMLNQLFSPPAVAAMRPMIAELTTETIDGFIERGSCDLVNELAGPVPALVTVRLLGLPDGHAPRFAKAIHDVFGGAPGSERVARGAAEIAWCESEVAALIAERRVRPGDDVISFFCTQVVDSEPLPDEVVLSIAMLLVGGGMDTTTSLTGQTLVWLSEHPEEREWLAGDPSLLESATEEFLRVFAPSQSMARTLRQPVEVRGCPMSAGERVLLPWVSANFDEQVFERAGEVVLERGRNRHLSFGLGFHRCVGAHLARAMFSEMMRQVLERLPDYRVLTEELVPYGSHGNQTGWDVAPAVFTPGVRTVARSSP